MISLSILRAVVLFGATQIMPDHVSIAAPAVSMARTTFGWCPNFEKPYECPDKIWDYCTDDTDCIEGLKCCDVGCEKNCVVPDVPYVPWSSPELLKVPAKDGCPSFLTPVFCPDNKKDNCTDDSVCPVGLKCCNVGCEKDCVVPDQVSTAAPNMSIAVTDQGSTAVPDQVSTAAPNMSIAGTTFGRCPNFEQPYECPDNISDYCTDDTDCIEGLKCCNVGCEKNCVEPIVPCSTTVPDQVSTAAPNMSIAAPNMSIAGKDGCPSFQIPGVCPDNKKDNCTDDSVCPVGLKCCNVGCEKDCVVPAPDQVSTAAPNMSIAVTDQGSTAAPNMSIAVPDQVSTAAPNMSIAVTDQGSTAVPDQVSTAAPNMSIAGTTFGRCPNFEQPSECPDNISDYCTDDTDCIEGLKCCNVGCEKNCVEPIVPCSTTVPDQVSTAAPNMSIAAPNTIPAPDEVSTAASETTPMNVAAVNKTQKISATRVNP